MFFVIVYDIASGTGPGAKRLRRVRKCCERSGVAVQQSVFECDLPAERYEQLKQKLESIISPEEDSVRFYLLGRKYEKRIERIGRPTAGWDRQTYVL